MLHLTFARQLLGIVQQANKQIKSIPQIEAQHVAFLLWFNIHIQFKAPNIAKAVEHRTFFNLLRVSNTEKWVNI